MSAAPDLCRRPATISIGVMAHNEEANIARLLEALRGQQLSGFEILEIVVVASGCTDATEAAVLKIAAREPRLRLVRQARREGKASAVNLFLKEARGDFVVLESADTLPFPRTLQHLLTPLSEPGVGMTGGHPQPVDSIRRFMGYSTQFFWVMHHRMAKVRPKLGELVAFRNVVRQIPSDTAVDEAAIEAVVVKSGYRILYVPDARVRNKGPETLRDYLIQRRRIFAGHRHLRSTQGYSVPSVSWLFIFKNLMAVVASHLRTVVKCVRERRFTFLRKYLRLHALRTVYVSAAVVLELTAWVLGAIDYHLLGRNPFVWEVARSTKRLD